MAFVVFSENGTGRFLAAMLATDYFRLSARSFEELRTVENIIYVSFFKTAIAKNLVKTDDKWDKCLQERTQLQFPRPIRKMFAYIYLFHNLMNAKELYEKYKNHLYNPLSSKEIGENSSLFNLMNSELLIKFNNCILEKNSYCCIICCVDWNVS